MRNNKGFTYIEIILYVVIFTLMMATLIPFAWTFINTGAKSATEQEVFSNARFIAQKIQFAIRNAANINTISSTSASFITSNPATNPTVIDLVNGAVRITEGTGSAVQLNSNDTSVSALLFTNYTSADLKTQHVGFVFTLNGKYATIRQEYVQSTTMESSAELRSH